MPVLLFVGYAVALALAVATSIVALRSVPACGVSALPLFGVISPIVESSPPAAGEAESDSRS